MSKPIDKEKERPHRNWFLSILLIGVFIFSSYFQVIYKAVKDKISNKNEKDLE